MMADIFMVRFDNRYQPKWQNQCLQVFWFYVISSLDPSIHRNIYLCGPVLTSGSFKISIAGLGQTPNQQIHPSAKGL
jgi:hypothetical protein